MAGVDGAADMLFAGQRSQVFELPPSRLSLPYS
jgi:hypothetical protein